MTTKIDLTNKITEMVKHCKAYELNICLECPYKVQCCEMAYDAYTQAR